MPSFLSFDTAGGELFFQVAILFKSNEFFRERTLLRYMLGSLFSTQGVWIQRLTLGWMAWSSTHSETWVGMIAFFMFFPTVIFGPFFGVLADRINLRAGVISLNFWNSLLSASMALMIAHGWHDPYLLLGFALLLGLTTSVYQPMRLALVSDLVFNPKYLQRAVASNSIIFNTSRFIGPALAGIIINHWGNATAFAVTAAFYLPMPLLLMRAKLNASARASDDSRKSKKKEGVLSEFRSGLNYARSKEFILCLLLVTLFTTVFARAFLELLPALVQSWFNQGVSELAMLTSSAGIAAVISGVWLSGLKQRNTMLAATRWGSIITAIVVILMGSYQNFHYGLLVIAGLAFFSTMAGIGSQTLIQMTVDRAFRGRVVSLWGAIVMGGASVGSLMLGTLMEHLGNRPVMIGAGILSLLTSIWVSRRLQKAAEDSASADSEAMATGMVAK